MNYFKEAENVLRHRKKLNKSLENLKHRRARLLGSGLPRGVGGMDYASPSVDGGMVSNTMQDCLELVQTQKDISGTEAKIKEVDDVLKQLSDDDRKILMMWYVEDKHKDEICLEFHYANRQSVYDRKNKAVIEFAVLYFGAGAMDYVG